VARRITRRAVACRITRPRQGLSRAARGILLTLTLLTSPCP